MAEDIERMCYVGNLPADITEELIEELFIQVGPLQKVVLRNNDSSKYALIVFVDEESVPFAIETLDGIRLFNTAITVKPKNGSKQESEFKRKMDKIRREESDKRRSCPDLMSFNREDNYRQSYQGGVSSFLPPPPPPPSFATPVRSNPNYKVPGSLPRDSWHTPPPSHGDRDYRHARSSSSSGRDSRDSRYENRRSDPRPTFPSKNNRSADRSREDYRNNRRDSRESGHQRGNSRNRW